MRKLRIDQQNGAFTCGSRAPVWRIHFQFQHHWHQATDQLSTLFNALYCYLFGINGLTVAYKDVDLSIEIAYLCEISLLIIIEPVKFIGQSDNRNHAGLECMIVVILTHNKLPI